MLGESANPAPRQYPGVMVSSTFTDLQELRAALIKAIKSEGLTDVAMENDSAKPDVDVIESSLQMVGDASAYVAIVSFKYGQTPQCPQRNPKGLSLTELEFNEAQRLGRPILLFIMGDRYRVCPADIESDPTKKEKLNAFRERAKLSNPNSHVHRVYRVFNDLNEFSEGAIHAVAGLRRYLDARQPPPPPPRSLPPRGEEGVPPPDPTTAFCNHCRKQIEVTPGSRYCVHCGKPLQAAGVRVKCKWCQTDNPADAEFCSKCSKRLRRRPPGWVVKVAVGAIAVVLILGIWRLWLAKLPTGVPGNLATFATATASSRRDGQLPERVKDGDTTTAWVEASSSLHGPRGQSVRLEFERLVEVDSVKLVNGYDKGAQWSRHGRVDTIQLEFANYGPSVMRKIADTRGYQTIALSGVGTRVVQIRIYSVYPAEQGYEGWGTAISEVEVWGRQK
jgi:hypothetical protein